MRWKKIETVNIPSAQEIRSLEKRLHISKIKCSTLKKNHEYSTKHVMMPINHSKPFWKIRMVKNVEKIFFYNIFINHIS